VEKSYPATTELSSHKEQGKQALGSKKKKPQSLALRHFRIGLIGLVIE
jgi:hypothetical protein